MIPDFDFTDAPIGLGNSHSHAWAAGANTVLDRVLMIDNLTDEQREEILNWVKNYNRSKR